LDDDWDIDFNIEDYYDPDVTLELETGSDAASQCAPGQSVQTVSSYDPGVTLELEIGSDAASQCAPGQSVQTVSSFCDFVIGAEEEVEAVICADLLDLDSSVDIPTSTLCPVCGIIEDCLCENGHDSITSTNNIDHDYSVRSTVRMHKRTGKQLTRKRNRCPSEWSAEKRKKLRQSGQEYTKMKHDTVTGTVTTVVTVAKTVKVCKQDHKSCRFKCANNISEDMRNTIHAQHWSLTDQEKRHFYIGTTTVSNKARTRRSDNREISKKKKSYSYYLKTVDKTFRVCKEFYLKTLCIDAKRVVNTHKSKNMETGTPAQYCRGKHVKKTNRAFKDLIRSYSINSDNRKSLL
jgi:hypothetical protein